MTEYTINLNQELNGIEIIFKSKPIQAILEAVKSNGFRWSNSKKLWYAKNTAERLTFAKSLGQAEITESSKTETSKPERITLDKEMLKAEYRKAWDSEKMVDYCVNDLANVAILPDGGIISIEKQSIKTSFCFGESGYDYEDAQKMAIHASKSFEYFKEQNMKSFNEWIADLEETLEENPKYFIVIRDIHYTGQETDCRLRSLEWLKTWQVLDAFGGSAYLSELPGKRIETHKGRIATHEEIKIILEAYKQARTAHEKKVDTYLKKYGLSKVDTWTYWREA